VTSDDRSVGLVCYLAAGTAVQTEDVDAVGGSAHKCDLLAVRRPDQAISPAALLENSPYMRGEIAQVDAIRGRIGHEPTIRRKRSPHSTRWHG